MNIAQEYIQGLKKAYHDNEIGEEWDAFAAVMHGADTVSYTHVTLPTERVV